MEQNVTELVTTVGKLVSDFAPIPAEITDLLAKVNPTDPAQAQAITDAVAKLQTLDAAIQGVQSKLAPPATPPTGGGTPTP